MASAGLSVAVHASAVAMFGYSLYYNILFVNLPSEVAATGRFNSFSAWPGKWKYLTVWNLVSYIGLVFGGSEYYYDDFIRYAISISIKSNAKISSNSCTYLYS
jgi:hypothetical protein